MKEWWLEQRSWLSLTDRWEHPNSKSYRLQRKLHLQIQISHVSVCEEVPMDTNMSMKPIEPLLVSKRAAAVALGLSDQLMN